MEAEDVAAEARVRGRIRPRDVAEEDEETATATATETAVVKRRKLEEEEVDGESRIISSPCVEFTNHGGIMPRGSAGPPETRVVVVGRTSSAEDQCQSPSSGDDLGGASISCCSSNGSSDKVDGRIEFLDLEPNGAGAEAGTSTHYSCNTRSEMSLCCNRREESDDMGSADAEVKACDSAESHQRNKADNRDMTVTKAELEEFFTASEKDLRIKVLDSSRKYNFDFDKEEPFDGRYEWVRLKP